MNRYLYRFICAVIMVLLSTSSFAYVWINFVRVNNQTGHLTGLGNIMMALGIYTFMFIIIGKWLNAFKIGVERKAKMVASVVMTVFVTDAIELFVSLAITGQFRFFFHFLWRYIVLALCQSIVLVLLVVIMIVIYRKIVPPLSVIEIVGKHNNNLARSLNGIKYKYSIKETVPYTDPGLEEKIKLYDAVLINDIPAEGHNIILKKCFEENKRVYTVPKISDIIIKSSDSINLVDTPLFLCRNLGINGWQLAVKRFADVFLSSIALIILSPVFLVTALAIKLEDGGPVFFRQDRVTLNDRRFMILKFRSMIVDAEKDGRPHPAGENDDRITKVGKIIRACRVDELPQLINIIKGDMSIVGPRPERWEHVEKYKKEIPEFSYRCKVKGGLTGYAQVYGKYNTAALDKLKLDLLYITNYSLSLDVQIIFETIKILFIKDSTEGFEQQVIQELHDSNPNPIKDERKDG